MAGAGYTLFIGDQNLSSWSLRPWFLMRQAGIPFIEEKIRLRGEGTRQRIIAYSPSGLVPALETPHGVVWDSLAIAEYLNESHKDKALWPADAAARAHARAISAEMHSGFAALRTAMPMNFVNRITGVRADEATARDIVRIRAIWSQCREAYGGDGPFLFGRFSIADAMYAPVVSRFRTYGVETGALEREYMDTIWKLPAMQEWDKGAAAEVPVG